MWACLPSPRMVLFLRLNFISMAAARKIVSDLYKRSLFLGILNSRSTFSHLNKISTAPLVRSFSDKSPQGYEDAMVADELEGTTGVERWELLQKVKGIDDPFQLSAKTVTAGTRDKPTLIPTISNQRTVGCLCEQDTPVIKWMRLHLGETKCCECGHWFRLVPLED